MTLLVVGGWGFSFGAAWSVAAGRWTSPSLGGASPHGYGQGRGHDHYRHQGGRNAPSVVVVRSSSLWGPDADDDPSAS